MVIRKSVQSKIRWLIISFTVAILVFFIVLLIIYAWVIEDNIFNRIVSEEASYMEHQFRDTGERVQPRIPFMSLYRDWSELPEHIQLLRQQSPKRIEFPLRDGGTIHIREVQLGKTIQLLSANVSTYEISMLYLSKLIPWILIVQMVIVLCAFVLARYLASGVVKPLQCITFTVANNKETNALKFDYVFSDDEIGYLAHTISKSFNRLHAALQREYDFSRDISHELRTPVAILKMVYGRLEAEKSLDEKSVKKVKSAIIEIEQSVDILLALSREESVHTESLALLQQVEHCIINHFVLSRLDDAKLDIDISAAYHIRCNKNLLRMLLNNLINNVVNHASAVVLRIKLTGNQLQIINPVDVCPPDDLLSPNVKADSSQGLGQGLHLVKRICEKYNWGVSVSHCEGQFTISIILA